MKINSLSLISIVSALTCACAADAAVLADFYVGGTAGVGGSTIFTDGKHDSASSQVYGGVVGMDLPILRIEGEYDYFNSKDYKAHAGLVHLYAKLPLVAIQPYVGAGAGMMFGGDHTVDSIKYDMKSTAAYQAMLGTTIDIFKIPLKFDIEGRVLYAPDIYKIEGKNIEPDMLQYGVRAKARFIF